MSFIKGRPVQPPFGWVQGAASQVTLTEHASAAGTPRLTLSDVR